MSAARFRWEGGAFCRGPIADCSLRREAGLSASAPAPRPLREPSTAGRRTLLCMASSSDGGASTARSSLSPFAEAVAQSRFENTAARSRKCTPEQPCATTSQRTARPRRTRWPFLEPTLRNDPAGSPGVYATASARSGRRPPCMGGLSERVFNRLGRWSRPVAGSSPGDSSLRTSGRRCCGCG
jgi:hypothetical protein